MRFLLDNNLSPRLARALNELSADHEVAHLRDRFDPRTPDAEWISQLGVEGDWVIVSGDVRISRNRDELAAWPKIITQAETVGTQVGYMVPVRGAKLRILSTK